VLAIKNKRKTIVKKLLKYGADLSIKSYDGKTPLQIAEEKGYKRIAEILQEYGNKTIGQNVCETENISANKETVKVL
jgi:ankyrin repeat protein